MKPELNTFSGTECLKCKERSEIPIVTLRSLNEYLYACVNEAERNIDRTMKLPPTHNTWDGTDSKRYLKKAQTISEFNKNNAEYQYWLGVRNVCQSLIDALMGEKEENVAR